MFWLLSVLAMLGFSLGYLFMTPLIRRIPTFQSASYRGLGLMITMAPFLLLVPKEDFLQIPNFALEILLSGIFSTISLWAYFKAIQYSPVGIASSLRQGFGVILLAILSIYFLENDIAPIQWILIFVILLANGYLGLTKSKGETFISSKAFIYSLIAGPTFALGYFFMAKVSIELSPFISGYLWEASVGILSLIISLLIKEHQEEPLRLNLLAQGTLRASPTVMGTFCAAFAITLGPAGITGAIGAGAIVVISVLSALIYKEKLSLRQWVTILVICGAIVGFKIL